MDFVRQYGYGKKFDLDVTFEMDSQRTWPIKLTVRSFKQSKPRVSAYGAGGWKIFLMDNYIKVGDVLIFSLISYSQFEVFIGRAPQVEVHLDDNGDDNGNNNEGEVDMDMDIEDKDKVDDKSLAKRFRNPSPSGRNVDQAPPCPSFLVAILPSSHPRHLSLVRHFSPSRCLPPWGDSKRLPSPTHVHQAWFVEQHPSNSSNHSLQPLFLVVLCTS